MEFPFYFNFMDDFHITILKNMIICCRNYNLKNFIPYLMSEKVGTNYHNKILFYSDLKKQLQYAKTISNGILVCRIEKKEYQINPNAHLFNFYDQTHKYERLSIEVEIENSKIILDIQPI